MRIFAGLYAVTAVIAAVVGYEPWGTSMWKVVCLSAAALAVVAAGKKPFVLAAAAHAGLTATWAGTLAARSLKASGYGYASSNTASMTMLLMLCAGMAVLIAAGLKSSPRAAAQTSPQR